MGALSETEIFDCLATNCRQAAEHAEKLAKLPAKGPTYSKLRDELRLVEGACRQASAWREDTRFLDIGRAAAQAHKVAGDWLRGIRMPDGSRRPLAKGELHPSFLKLAEFLRHLHAKAESARTARTNRIGMILPDVLPGPHRDTRPVGWNRSAGGLLVPSGVAAQ